MNRWVEISFIEDIKSLQKQGLKEYYNKANNGLYEFLNPDLAYEYEVKDMSNSQKMWVVEKINNDPQFLITLKKDDINKDYFILDFYFYETGFSKQKGLEGKHYLDTLTKVFKDEIIPYFLTSKENLLYFTAYSEDGSGSTRKKVFEKIISKFVDTNKFDVEIKGMEFFINKLKKIEENVAG